MSTSESILFQVTEMEREYKDNFKLSDLQREGICFCVNAILGNKFYAMYDDQDDRKIQSTYALLGDMMGMGKTIQAFCNY